MKALATMKGKSEDLRGAWSRFRPDAPMTGKHCHENGTCHDHPDDGKDYG